MGQCNCSQERGFARKIIQKVHLHKPSGNQRLFTPQRNNYLNMPSYGEREVRFFIKIIIMEFHRRTQTLKIPEPIPSPCATWNPWLQGIKISNQTMYNPHSFSKCGNEWGGSQCILVREVGGGRLFLTEPVQSMNWSLASKGNCIPESIKAHPGWLADFAGTWLSPSIRPWWGRRPGLKHRWYFLSETTWLRTQLCSLQ